jgi:hypothetical protein
LGYRDRLLRLGFGRQRVVSRVFDAGQRTVGRTPVDRATGWDPAADAEYRPLPGLRRRHNPSPKQAAGPGCVDRVAGVLE